MDIFNLELPEENNDKLDAWFEQMNKQMERLEESRHSSRLNSMLSDNDINNNMENRLLNGEMIDFENETNTASVWFNKQNNRFCLELNAKVIKATKSFKPIENKLKMIGDLSEVL